MQPALADQVGHSFQSHRMHSREPSGSTEERSDRRCKKVQEERPVSEEVPNGMAIGHSHQGPQRNCRHLQDGRASTVARDRQDLYGLLPETERRLLAVVASFLGGMPRASNWEVAA
jgi:hypothetical protein